MESVAAFERVPLVITEKLDGSNLALTREAVFARSHAAAPTHASFAWAKALHARLAGRIEPGITLFGEYCYAVHSIVYEALPSYFFLFGVRDDMRGEWWSWDRVETQAQTLELATVPVLFTGECSDLQRQTAELAAGRSRFGGEREGVVVRVAAAFDNEEFPAKVGKYVRSGHVTTTEHWMHQEIRVQKRR